MASGGSSDSRCPRGARAEEGGDGHEVRREAEVDRGGSHWEMIKGHFTLGLEGVSHQGKWPKHFDSSDSRGT